MTLLYLEDAFRFIFCVALFILKFLFDSIYTDPILILQGTVKIACILNKWLLYNSLLEKKHPDSTNTKLHLHKCNQKKTTEETEKNHRNCTCCSLKVFSCPPTLLPLDDTTRRPHHMLAPCSWTYQPLELVTIHGHV
ncbi:uncharacterized protein LOC144578359 [Callithrix jacchus]